MKLRSFCSASIAVALFLAASSAAAQNVSMHPVDRWIVYGTQRELARDRGVPGEGVVRAKPRVTPGEPWDSGAVLSIPETIRQGQKVAATFWAKADRETRIPVSIAQNAAPYTSIATATFTFGPKWRRFSLQGVAAADLQAGTQAVTVQLGKTASEVTLGPVAIATGDTSAARIEAAIASFNPDRVAVDVRIASAPGVTLAGTLRTPLGHGRGPFPVAVFIAGSGPNGRGGFYLLMNRLLADGIATLEYDKRGVGQSTGTFVDALPLMVTDAAAAVAFLRGRREIDPRRIALIGHSQGGSVAPAVAARDPRIAAIVMLAGPVRPGRDLVISQLQDQLAGQGVPAPAIDRLVVATEQLLDAHNAGASENALAALRGKLLEEFGALGADKAAATAAVDQIDTSATLAFWNSRSDLALAAVKCPVLALFASIDILVPPIRDMPAARRALIANPDATVVEIAGVNHVFQHAKTGSMEEFKRWVRQTPPPK